MKKRGGLYQSLRMRREGIYEKIKEGIWEDERGIHTRLKLLNCQFINLNIE